MSPLPPLTLTTGYKLIFWDFRLEHCFYLKLIGTRLDILILEHCLFVISFDDSSLAARRLHNAGVKCAVIHHWQADSIKGKCCIHIMHSAFVLAPVSCYLFGSWPHCCWRLILMRRLFIGSTSKSRSNNIRGGECPSVRTSVRPSTKSFFDFNEIWYIGRGR